jgi:hypothetical protein
MKMLREPAALVLFVAVREEEQEAKGHIVYGHNP